MNPPAVPQPIVVAPAAGGRPTIPRPIVLSLPPLEKEVISKPGATIEVTLIKIPDSIQKRINAALAGKPLADQGK